MEKNEIEISNFANGTTKLISVDAIEKDVHGGGDTGLMNNFVSLVERECLDSLTSAELSVQSHLMSFAAEQSRLENKVIQMDEFIKECQRGISLR